MATNDRLGLSLSSANGEFAPTDSEFLSSASYSLAEAAYGLEGARSIGSFDSMYRAFSRQPARRSGHSRSPRPGAAPVAITVNEARAPPSRVNPLSRRVDTARPETLTDSFIERRLANLQLAIGKLAPGGVAHAKLVAQAERLQSEGARRRATELPPTASPTSLQPGVAHPSGSARSAILAARGSPQALCRFVPLPDDADP